MSTTTSIAQAIVDAIRAAVGEVDAWDVAGFEPAVHTRSVALVGTALGQVDEVRALSVGGAHEVTHELRFHLWTKVVRGDESRGVRVARDVSYAALRAVVQADGDGYMLMPGQALTARTDENVLVVGEIPYIRTILTIPVWQEEG